MRRSDGELSVKKRKPRKGTETIFPVSFSSVFTLLRKENPERGRKPYCLNTFHEFPVKKRKPRQGTETLNGRVLQRKRIVKKRKPRKGTETLIPFCNMTILMLRKENPERGRKPAAGSSVIIQAF